ncbi:hypothetical protein MHLP_01580 [Candidatus Mycoplasma haematolamae str. Purdue]|uniref:Uncharacterized protein n=1 Tax=Mycoplasma haematolamae (strain Purdue) TaxID=1212765 RepID=I7CF69_MYCHA|nr:hypothetical protein [Candidatus Mycoplasma haematolamae]AFO51896.1 hypothetical protein MHLP_01580 [Candidatus Mycoplasma haematolamae str. Purdue]
MSIKAKLLASAAALLGVNGISWLVLSSKGSGSIWNVFDSSVVQGMKISNVVEKLPSDSKFAIIGNQLVVARPNLERVSLSSEKVESQNFVQVLKENTEIDEDFLVLSELATPEFSQSLVKEISEESVKENAVIDLESSRAHKIRAHTKAINEKILSDYRQVLQLVKLRKARKSNQDTTYKPARLTEGQREAVKTVYKKFSRLKKNGEELLETLGNVNEGKEMTKSLNPDNVKRLPELQKIIEVWRELGWTHSSQIRIPKSTSDPLYVQWKEWDKNPYKHFYSSEENWKKDWENFSNAWKKLRVLAKTENLARLISKSATAIDSSGHAQEVQKAWHEVLAAEAEIEMTVATWLVEKMGQLNQGSEQLEVK